MPLTQVTDHVSQAINRLAFQFQDKPNILALLTVQMGRIQDLEGALWSIYSGRPYPVAVGDALTRWGETVGAPRPASGAATTDDTAYRPLVQVRIIANTSNGTPEEVLSMLRIAGADAVILTEPNPATMALAYQGDLWMDDASFLGMLKKAMPPINLFISQFASQPFGFDSSSYGFDQGELGRNLQ